MGAGCSEARVLWRRGEKVAEIKGKKGRKLGDCDIKNYVFMKII